MPLLKMDVEAVTTVQQQLLAARRTMDGHASSLNSLVQGMVGSTWVAPGAEKFKEEFSAWLNNTRVLLEALEQNGQQLGREITKWQDEAQTY